jgi:predicted 3-demethylubiquinone-9 3-methyltransferase (glyoxalase superfamily)
MQQKQKIVPCLWFDGQAEEAVRHYATIFKTVKTPDVVRYGDVGPGKPGSVLTITFEIDGQEFMGLNGGPNFKFNEAISFVVNCQTQAEVDDLWEKLSAGGAKSQCGWLKDKFGVSWQIVPVSLVELLRTNDAAATGRMMAALMQMTKLDIEALKRAYEGR